MKKLLFFSLGLLLCTSLLAQKPKGKAKGPKAASTESVPATKKAKTKQDGNVWEGTSEGPKPSKNQPAKVRSAFGSDYPGATDVRWSKYRGDWTATFRNGIVRSTAVYHANGARKDTRTVISQPDLPKVILDEILKKRPRSILETIIRIQVPDLVREIFRIKTTEGGNTRFLFYNAEGKEVKYDY